MQLKRFIMILLVVILAVSAATITVAADTGATLEMAVEVTSSTAISDSPLTVMAGDIVTVRITIVDNPGISMFITRFTYDPEIFHLENTITVNDKNLNIISDAVTGDVLNGRNQFQLKEDGYIYGMSATNLNDTSEEGLLIELTFKAKAAAGLAEFCLESTAGDVAFTGKTPQNKDQFSIKTENASVLVHNMVLEKKVEASCTNNGYSRYVCSGCDYSEIRDTVSAFGHTPVQNDYTAPTCTEPGYTGGKYCSTCEEVLVPAGEIPATGHIPQEGATCLEDTYCSVCEVLMWEATDHIPGADATCTEAQICTVCKTELTPATGHTPGAGATCNEAQTCVTCGETLAAAQGHKPGAAATCHAPQICIACGEVVAEQLSHKWGNWEIVTNATEEENGLKKRTCSACGEIDEEIIPMLGKKHDYEAVVVPPTCTEKGYTEYICKECGDTYQDDFTEMIPHDFDAVVTEPTCTEKGYTTFTCSVCELIEKDEYVDAVGHDHSGPGATCNAPQTCLTCGEIIAEMTVHAANWEIVAKLEPTCVTPGHESYIFCNLCQVYAKEKVDLPATGQHTPGAEATCTTAQICTVCNAEIVAAKGHTPGAGATCTTAQNCTVCGEELAAALGHTPGAEATCTTAQTCTVCGNKLTPAKGHTEVVDAAVAATCTTEGKTEGKHCSVCSEVIVAQETVPAAGHTEGEWIVTQEPAIGAEGLRQKACTVCGEVVASEPVEALTAPETEPATEPETDPETKEEDTSAESKTESGTNSGDNTQANEGCLSVISGTGTLVTCILMAGGAWLCSSRKKEQD